MSNIGRDRIRMCVIERREREPGGKRMIRNFKAAIDFNYTNYGVWRGSVLIPP